MNFSRTICWKAYPFAIFFLVGWPKPSFFLPLKSLCRKSTGQIHVGLFMNSLFCSINLCVYPFTYTAVTFKLVLKSYRVVIQLLCSSFSTFFFFLVIPVPLLFHINFKINLELHWSCITWGEWTVLTMLSTPIDKHGLSSHFFRSSLIYFICFKVSNIETLHIFCKVYTYIFNIFRSYYKWYLNFFFYFQIFIATI